MFICICMHKSVELSVYMYAHMQPYCLAGVRSIPARRDITLPCTRKHPKLLNPVPKAP